MASLSSFPQLVLNPYLYSFFFFSSLSLSFLFLLSFAVGLGNNVAGTQSFWGKCKLQAALSPVCFLIGKQHFRELNWRQGSVKTCRVQEYSLFPGPGCVEVGLSEEGALWDGGEVKGTFRSGCSRLRKESRSNQSSAVLQTIRSFGGRETKQSLRPVHKCKRLALSVCAGL